MPLQLDLHHTPFSRCGSYFSISFPTWLGRAGRELHLLTHHGHGCIRRELFRIGLHAGGRKVAPARVDATPVRLRLKAKGKSHVTFCISPSETVRIRGEGVGLRMVLPVGPHVVAHPAPGGRWVVNARLSRRKYLFECLRGRLQVDAPWRTTTCERIVVRFLPDESGVFEGAIDEFQSTWLPRRRPAFERCLREVEKDFAAWLERQPCAPRTLRRAWEHAAYVNWSALVHPEGLLTRPAMFMSKRVMDQVWSWDHCFNAMALAYRHPALAWDQFMVILDQQDAHGVFPDTVNDVCRQYNFTKPPVHGWTLGFMRRRNPRAFGRKRLREAYRPLVRWTDWWMTSRVWPGDVLPHYLHGNDSGWDNSTLFDEGVPVVAPDLAAFLALQMEELSEVAKVLGRNRAARRWREASRQLVRELVAQLWRDDRFVAVRRPDAKLIDCDSLITCLPVVLGHRLPEAVQRALVRRIGTFLTEHGLATERPSSGRYESDGYWRGPIWAPSTMLIVSGLRALGREALARKIARRFCRMCARSGFAENFNALTGEALRDRAYTWTSSVFLVLAHEYLTRLQPGLTRPGGPRRDRSRAAR